MDEELRRRIQERARVLWERDGRPKDAEVAYLAQAEEELTGESESGEEDPSAALEPPPTALERQGGR